MEKRISVEEKFSPHWFLFTLAAGILSALFLIIYTFIDDVLASGIVRLAGFVFLASTVLGGLKLMDGKHKMDLEIIDRNIRVAYHKNDELVSEDIFDIDNIETVAIEPRPSALFGSTMFFNDLNILLHLSDSDRTLNLIEIDSRILALDPQNTEKIVTFFMENDETSNIPVEGRQQLDLS